MVWFHDFSNLQRNNNCSGANWGLVCTLILGCLVQRHTRNCIAINLQAGVKDNFINYPNTKELAN